jgi:hypothetical protein
MLIVHGSGVEGRLLLLLCRMRFVYAIVEREVSI